MRKMIAMARKVAVTHSAVLIRGESGTGKELLAAAIHRGQPARIRSVCQAALRGAFAKPARERAFRPRQECVHRCRPRSRRTVRAGRRRHVVPRRNRRHQPGGPDQAAARAPGDVVRARRKLAADHGRRPDPRRDPPGPRGPDPGRTVSRRPVLPAERHLTLPTPALRERREDIFELAVYFLNLHAGRTGKLVTHLDPEAVEALVAYDWPGNIRELENTIERAVVLADGPSVTLDDLPLELRQPPGRRRLRPRIAGGRRLAARRRQSTAQSRPHLAGLPLPLRPGVQRAGEPSTGEDWNAEFVAYERQRLIDALNEAGGNKSVAARLLGMPRSTFFSKMKKHGVV